MVLTPDDEVVRKTDTEVLGRISATKDISMATGVPGGDPCPRRGRLLRLLEEGTRILRPGGTESDPQTTGDHRDTP